MENATPQDGVRENLRFDVPATGNPHLRIAVVALLVLAVTGAHWWTPRGGESLLVIHVALRKLYILPVVMAAVWFDLRVVLLAALAVTLLYMPHVVLQWDDQRSENINQVGEIATIWVTAVLAGTFVGREKNALARLAGAYGGSVTALVTALDAREHHTQQHSLRVRAYTMRLARELGIRPAEQRIYALGALLHDVGKIGVPDSILLKPGRLSNEEWERIKEHPAIGRRILSSVPFLHEATGIVYAHHEKFDGTGYPRGLAGREIPFGARLFAVADVFDALTSDRPYKGTLSYDEARIEIEAGSGSHFDPEVVAAFLGVAEPEWDRIRSAIEATGCPSPPPPPP